MAEVLLSEYGVQMRIFKFDFLAAGSVMLAIMLGHASAYGQLDHSKLMNEYQRQMQQLPPISVATNFKSLITEDELKARFEPYSQDKLRGVIDYTTRTT